MPDLNDRAANAIDRANQKSYEKLTYYREVMKRFEEPKNIASASGKEDKGKTNLINNSK